MLFYAPTGSEVPGICGKGAIERYSPRNETITFSVTLPTDFLRERPWWNSKAKIAVNDIRGFPPRGTLFYVNRRQAAMLREGLSEWLRIADQ